MCSQFLSFVYSFLQSFSMARSVCSVVTLEEYCAARDFDIRHRVRVAAEQLVEEQSSADAADEEDETPEMDASQEAEGEPLPATIGCTFFGIADSVSQKNAEDRAPPNAAGTG